MSGTRKWLIALVVWCVILEGAAWIADSFFGFRYTLLDRLAQAERSMTPMAEVAPEWEPHTLRVRVPDRGDPRDEPYAIGGRVIEDAWPDAKQDPLHVDDLADERRPRVFLLGGSAALGYPYAYEDSTARQLQRRRSDLRVINVGQVGWTSGQLVGIARRIAEEFEPATFVVYSGNNEWIHWAPQAGSFDPSLHRTLAHSRAAAAALYLGHSWAPPPDDEPPLFGYEHALRHPAPGFDFAAWTRQRAAFLDRFADNLRAIQRIAADVDANVVFVTVPFQYKLSPTFRHPQPRATRAIHEVEIEDRISMALTAIRAERWQDAITELDSAIELDPDPALLHYLRAVATEALEEHEHAEQHYAQSRDRMVGNLGGRLAINEVIRTVAAETDAPLVDAREIFDAHEHTAGRYYNESLIHDDCHPTPAGQRVLARALAEVL